MIGLDHTRASFSLAGRTALITGASRGIGQALAVAFAGAGADVVITARRREALDETSALVAAAGASAEALVLDVRLTGEIAAAVSSLGRPLDILVNNAGIESVRPSLDVEEALWDTILDTNLKGAFFCSQAFARLPARDDRGRAILNLCSLTSEVGIPTAVPYGTSKTGLVGMTRALSAEWAPAGIRVNGIGPGYFRTGMTEGFYADPDWQRAMLAKIPLGRFGRLEDLMGAAIFLCSPAAAYITGQVLYVDGGTLASI